MGKAGVKELKDSDFYFEGGVCKLKSDVCTAILFYAPWCPHCVAVKEEWLKFGKRMKTNKGINVAAFNCDKYQDFLREMRENMVSVMSFPTMLVFKKRVPDRQIGYNSEQRKVDVFERECIGLCGSS